MEHLIPKSHGGTQNSVIFVCIKRNRIRTNNMSDPDFIDGKLIHECFYKN